MEKPKNRNMRKEREDGVTIDPRTLLNEIIWPATRYCVPRHTYVCSYARVYWDIIRHNRDKFDEVRLQFYARDIKERIAETMCFWRNVECENWSNDRIEYDPYFLLTRYLYYTPNCVFEQTDFEIDCITGQVKTFPRRKPLTEAEMTWSKAPNMDLFEWSKLASCIADAEEVTLTDGTTQRVIETYDYVLYEDGNEGWEKRLITVERWGVYVPEENIIENP